MANPVTITPPLKQKDLSRRTVLAGIALSTVPQIHFKPNVAEGAPVSELRRDAHPVLALPFVRDTSAYERTLGASPRSFWHVTPSGSYASDCATGAEYAALAVDYMLAAKSPHMLPWVVIDMMAMRRPHSGIEVGFLSAVGRLAVLAGAQSTLVDRVAA